MKKPRPSLDILFHKAMQATARIKDEASQDRCRQTIQQTFAPHVKNPYDLLTPTPSYKKRIGYDLRGAASHVRGVKISKKNERKYLTNKAAVAFCEWQRGEHLYFLQREENLNRPSGSTLLPTYAATAVSPESYPEEDRETDLSDFLEWIQR